MKKLFQLGLTLNLIIILSCSNQNSFNKDGLKTVDGENSKILNINFHDTIKANNNIHGELIYNLKLDTIKQSDIVERFLFLYVTSESLKVGGYVDEIKKTSHKIFTDTIGNGIIEFNVEFNEKGKNLLTCVLQDVLFLKGRNNEEALVEYIIETEMHKKVYVQD